LYRLKSIHSSGIVVFATFWKRRKKKSEQTNRPFYDPKVIGIAGFVGRRKGISLLPAM